MCVGGGGGGRAGGLVPGRHGHALLRGLRRAYAPGRCAPPPVEDRGLRHATPRSAVPRHPHRHHRMHACMACLDGAIPSVPPCGAYQHGTLHQLSLARLTISSSHAGETKRRSRACRELVSVLCYFASCRPSERCSTTQGMASPCRRFSRPSISAASSPCLTSTESRRHVARARRNTTHPPHHRSGTLPSLRMRGQPVPRASPHTLVVVRVARHPRRSST